METSQLDAKNAFLTLNNLDKLEYSINGLKQQPRVSNDKVSKALTYYKLQQCHAVHSILWDIVPVYFAGSICKCIVIPISGRQYWIIKEVYPS